MSKLMRELEQDGYVFPGKRIAKSGAILGEGHGMTVRDWFAGQALNALIEDVNRPTDCEQSDAAGHPADDIARRAYRIADAMIAARKVTS